MITSSLLPFCKPLFKLVQLLLFFIFLWLLPLSFFTESRESFRVSILSRISATELIDVNLFEKLQLFLDPMGV
jgi:hypothetical protein